MGQTQKDDLAIGDELSGYRLTAHLGEGGMATVFRGENLLDSAIVRAIKVVHSALGARKELVTRFAVEARTLEKLAHPNVVRFFGVRQDRGRLVMELELLEGKTLASKVAPGARLAEIVGWVIQAGDGIVAAHALGVLHRDVKPDNLFLTNDGVVKVLDFGIARALDEAEGATRPTAAGTTPGTAAYLAPESWRGAAPSPATDVYALGLTLLELALGYHPFLSPGQPAKSAAQLMYAHLEEKLPLLRAARPDASAALEAIAAKATARDPGERYSTVSELVEALRASLTAIDEGVAPPPRAGAAESTSFALPQFDPSSPIVPVSDAPAAALAPAPLGDATSFALEHFDPTARTDTSRPPSSGESSDASSKAIGDPVLPGPVVAPVDGAPESGPEVDGLRTTTRPSRALLAGAAAAVVLVAAVGLGLAKRSTAKAEEPPPIASSSASATASELSGATPAVPSAGPPETLTDASTVAVARATKDGGAVEPRARREAALREAAEFGQIGLVSLGDGGMQGDSIGDSFGAGGLGLSGVGEGGGGRGEGIGLGNIGTLGHGAGTGTGSAHGTKAPTIRIGATQVTGRLPPEVIQRIVRQNFGRFRLCYESGLKKNPKLAGKVTTRFVIGRDGGVTSVGDGGSTLSDVDVGRCVRGTFPGLSFPEPEGGVVSVVFPIDFAPGE